MRGREARPQAATGTNLPRWSGDLAGRREHRCSFDQQDCEYGESRRLRQSLVRSQEQVRGLMTRLGALMLAALLVSLTGCPDNPYKPETWTKQLDDPREA